MTPQSVLDALADAETLLMEALAKSGHASDCPLRQHVNARNVIHATNYARIRGKHKRAAYGDRLRAEWDKDKPVCGCWKSRAKNFLNALAAFRAVPALREE